MPHGLDDLSGDIPGRRPAPVLSIGAICAAGLTTELLLPKETKEAKKIGNLLAQRRRAIHSAHGSRATDHAFDQPQMNADSDQLSINYQPSSMPCPAPARLANNVQRTNHA